jgi:peptidoglycan/xylan/chitin deacetylase (PgdA/CDA1 family)
MKKYILLLISLIFLDFPEVHAQTVTISDWLNNKKGAVSVTLDDAFQNQFKIAQSIMDSYGIKGTFFIITNPALTGSGGDPVNWSQMQNAIDNGHEIAGHTVNHPHLNDIMANFGADSVDKELRCSQETLRKNLVFPVYRNCITMAYPNGSGGEKNVTAQQVRNIAHKYYIGARAAETGADSYITYGNSSNTNVFMDFYYQVESMNMYDTSTFSYFASKVNGAIDHSGWFLPMYHQIEIPDQLSVSSAAFQEQMDFLNNNKNVLWLAPFVDVLIYHKEKRSAQTSIISNNAQSAVIALTDTLPDTTYNAPLTLRVSGLGNNIDSITQGADKLTFLLSGGIIQFNAVPDRGDIIIYKTQAPLASGSIQGKDTTCIGMQSYSVPNVSGMTYTWTLSGGGTISGTGNSISVHWTNAGTHTLTVISSNGAGNSPSSSLNISVTANVPAQPGAISGEISTSLGTTEYYSLADQGVDYQWTLSGGGIMSDCNNCIADSIKWISPGTFTLTITPSNVCGKGQAAILNVQVNDSLPVSQPTGITNNDIRSDINIYPSPNEGNFTIEFKTPSSYLIRIINIIGQEVFYETLSETRNISLNNIQKGIYYVLISNENSHAVEKIIVK